MKLPVLEKAKVFGKTVFLRLDLDVPLTKFEIRNLKFETKVEDDTRLVAGLPTIEFLLENGSKVIVAGHIGRPKPINQESFDSAQDRSGIRNQELSLRSVAEWLIKRFHNSLFMLHDSKRGEFDGWEITPKLFLLENLRFYDSEETNDEEFSKKLASLADIYVNDAFAVCHRAHASIVSVPKYLPHFAGLRLQEEIKVLSGVLDNPKRPLVVIIGGAKIETKLPLAKKMCNFADYVLVGGKIAKEITVFLKVQHEKVKNRKTMLLVADLNQDGSDITPKSVDNFLQIVSLARTVVWNGPVGKISNKDSEYGTLKLAEGIVRSKAYTVVGGGDTVGFLKNLGVLDKFSFVSTGGGAMLEFLSGKKLPGLIALLF